MWCKEYNTVEIPAGDILAGIKGEISMAEQPDELGKLVTVATDLVLSAKLRAKSIELIGDIGNHEALLALLDLAANEKLTRNERELSLKLARDIIRSGHG